MSGILVQMGYECTKMSCSCLSVIGAAVVCGGGTFGRCGAVVWWCGRASDAVCVPSV